MAPSQFTIENYVNLHLSLANVIRLLEKQWHYSTENIRIGRDLDIVKTKKKKYQKLWLF